MRKYQVMGIFVLCLAVVAHPEPAEASARLNLGGNYWFTKAGVFDLTLALDTPVVRSFSIGGRAGAAITVDPATAAIPVDFVLRLTVRQFYFEGLLGPWIFFKGDALRFHGSFGFGLQRKSFLFGIEVGYLDPEPIIGFKIGFRL